MSQKIIFQVVNVPWVNSTVDVWLEETPSEKTRLVVLGFKVLNQLDLPKLELAVKAKLNLDSITLEEAN